MNIVTMAVGSIIEDYELESEHNDQGEGTLIDNNYYILEFKGGDVADNEDEGVSCNQVQHSFNGAKSKERECNNGEINEDFTNGFTKDNIRNSEASGNVDHANGYYSYERSLPEQQSNRGLVIGCGKEPADCVKLTVLEDKKTDYHEDTSEWDRRDTDDFKLKQCNGETNYSKCELLSMTANYDYEPQLENYFAHDQDCAQQYKIITIRKEYKLYDKTSLYGKESSILHQIKSLEKQTNISNERNNDDQDKDYRYQTTLNSDILFKDITKSPEEMIICEYCLKVFANQHKLNSHHYKKHRLSKKYGEKNIRKQNGDQNTEDVWPPNIQKLARRVNKRKMFFCDKCSYSVDRCDSITKHIYRVHSEGRSKPQWQCEVCGKLFGDKAYLRNHAVSHARDKLHSCDVCGRTFHRQPSLKRHLLLHSVDRRYSCSLCDYQSNRKHLMYQHARRHRQGRVFQCRVCGALSHTQRAHRAHLYTHPTTRHACALCRLAFSSKNRFMSHLHRTHSALEINLILENKDLDQQWSMVQDSNNSLVIVS